MFLTKENLIISLQYKWFRFISYLITPGFYVKDGCHEQHMNKTTDKHPTEEHIAASGYHRKQIRTSKCDPWPCSDWLIPIQAHTGNSVDAPACLFALPLVTQLEKHRGLAATKETWKEKWMTAIKTDALTDMCKAILTQMLNTAQLQHESIMPPCLKKKS